MDWRSKIRNPNCELCPLHEEAEHVCLMGAGKRSAKIMIVGEAPGAREDESHEAFVGPAGVLLNELLKEAGLKRSDCYITNVAKCRPPDNRTPKKGEIKTCVSAYLQSEIDRVQPTFILTLGNSALQGVVGRSGIKKHRGSVFSAHGATVLATLHPAAALRNPYLTPELRADFQRLGRLVRGESEKDPIRLRLIRRHKQLDALVKLLSTVPRIAFDLETYVFDNGERLKGKPVTSNFQEWRSEHAVISCISVAWSEHDCAVIPLWHQKSPFKEEEEEVLKKLKPILERKDCKYIAHNGKFDCRWLAAFKVFTPLTFDTMLAAHMLDENRSKGLKPLSEVLLGADGYDIGEDVGNSYYAPLKRLSIYAGKDAIFTYRLYKKFKQQLAEEPRTARIFKLMMMPASNMLTKVERHGIWVDSKRVDERLKETEENVTKIRNFMYRYVPVEKRPRVPDPNVRHTKKYLKEIEGINFNSPQQVADWLFNDLGLDILEETDTGNPSTAESVLLRLSNDHVACRALLKYRKWAKYRDTYLLPLKYKHTDATSRAHPTYKLFGTVTGRLSCADPNLQQIPRNPFLRAVYGAPPGWTFIEADYSQIELRIAAMLANESNLLRVFHEGRDPHMEVAVKLTGLPVEEVSSEQRKMAKPVNFGFLYGMGWRKFVSYARDNYEVVFTEKEAQEAREEFFKLWPRLVTWHDRQRRLVRNHHRVQSPIGRIRHLPDVSSGDKEVRAEAERQAINSPVQSFASDLMLMSALQLHDLLDPARCLVVGSIHDALGFQCRTEDLATTVPVIRRVMLNPPLKKWFGTELTVPIDVEIKTGQHWGEGKVWHEES